MLVNSFENMAVEYLSITEQWIRQKVKLQHKCLADVRSLCLPGTYEGKIHNLGNALKNFTRLKTLDLSHNALVSVEGIQHLKMLEVVNLYYNRIPSFKDIVVLCKLKALRDLDLRLNPVVKSCPDYRLYLVHALSNLRRLDDCPVRDSERRAALLHFSSDTTFESQPTSFLPSDRTLRSSLPRMVPVNRMLKKRCFLDDNDEAVLNLVAKSSLDLPDSADLKASPIKEPQCQLYDLEEKDSIQKYNGNKPATSFLFLNQDSAKSILRHTQEMDTTKGSSTRGRHNSGSVYVFNQEHQPEPGVMGLNKDDMGPRVTFADGGGHVGDSQWQQPNWFQLTSRIPAQSNFTPKPEDPPAPSTRSPSTVQARPSCSSRLGCRTQGGFVQHADSQELPVVNPKGSLRVEGMSSTEDRSSKQELIFNSSCGKCLTLLLGLVDKHWNGKGSLQCCHKFLAHALQILSKLEQDTSSRGEDVKSLKVIIESLNTQRWRDVERHQSEVQSLHRRLDQAHSSVEDLNQQLKNTLEENLSLQKQLIELEQRLLRCRIDGVPPPNKRQSAGLRKDVEVLSEGFQQAEDLQESHRSLVSTNEHLLAELQESKARHQAELQESKARHQVELQESKTRHQVELEQLYGHFCELKRTKSLVPATSKRKT